MPTTVHTNICFSIALQSLQGEQTTAFQDWNESGFGGNFKANSLPFIAMYVQSYLIKKLKGLQIHTRTSVNFNAVDTWIATSHIHSKFRDALKQYFFVKSSSIHKYSIPGGTKLLHKHNDSLRELFEAMAPIGLLLLL